MRISKALYETWVCRKFNAVVRCVSCFIIVDDIVRVRADGDVHWRRKAGHISALGIARRNRSCVGRAELSPLGRAAVVGVDGGHVEWIVRAVPFDGCFVCEVATLVKRFSNLRPAVLYTKDC